MAERAGERLVRSAFMSTIRRAQAAVPRRASGRSATEAGGQPPVARLPVPMSAGGRVVMLRREVQHRSIERVGREAPPTVQVLERLREVKDRPWPARALPPKEPPPRQAPDPKPVVLRVEFDHFAVGRLEGALAEIIQRAAEDAVAGLLGGFSRERP